MHTTAVYIKPLSSFTRRRIRSDTIFGALCWGIRQTYGEALLTEILGQFAAGTPPFLLSSAFPYDSACDMHYLPMVKQQPLHKEIDSTETLRKLKHLKKIALMPQSLFNRYITGDVDQEDLFKSLTIAEKKHRDIAQYDIDGTVYIQKGEALIEKACVGPLSYTNDVARNRLNRLSGSTTLFHQTETTFSQDINLYFMLKQNGYRQEIRSALAFLQDRGIGGNVSVGKGNISVTLKDADIINEATDAPYFTTLSLYCPTKDEIAFYQKHKEDIWYTLLRRKGKIESSYVSIENVWKDTVHYFEEGSMFPNLPEKERYGHNPIVKQEPFDVQQYGYAFPVGVKP